MRAQLTEHYVLVETDDIDFSTLRIAVEQFKLIYSEQPAEKPVVELVEEYQNDKRLPY